MIGLGSGLADQPAKGSGAASVPEGPETHVIALSAQLRDLQAQVDRLRSERNHWADVQQKIMDLLGSKSPERIMHDLRNVLNERELFKALADIEA